MNVMDGMNGRMSHGHRGQDTEDTKDTEDTEDRTHRTQTQTQVDKRGVAICRLTHEFAKEMNEPHSHFSFIMVTNYIFIAFLVSFSLCRECGHGQLACLLRFLFSCTVIVSCFFSLFFCSCLHRCSLSLSLHFQTYSIFLCLHVLPSLLSAPKPFMKILLHAHICTHQQHSST